MLLNNFKLLFQFYPDNTFVNVLGDTVYKQQDSRMLTDITDIVIMPLIYFTTIILMQAPIIIQANKKPMLGQELQELSAILTFTADTTDLFYLQELVIHLRHLMITNSKMQLNLEF